MLNRLKLNGANVEDLTDVYIKQVRSVLEFGVPVWNSNVKKEEILDIERVQKCFLHLTLGNLYTSYEAALEIVGLETLEDRRTSICLKFALKHLNTLNMENGLSPLILADLRPDKKSSTLNLHSAGWKDICKAQFHI